MVSSEVRYEVWVYNLHTIWAVKVPLCIIGRSVRLLLLILPHTINLPRLYCKLPCMNLGLFRLIFPLYSRIRQWEDWIQNVSEHLIFNHVAYSLNAQQSNFLEPYGVLMSKECAPLPYVYRNYFDEVYFGLFGLIPSTLFLKETVLAAEWHCVFFFDEFLS